MKKGVLALILFGTFAAVTVSATLHPLQVRTGLWQLTETITWSGLPPRLSAALASTHTHNYQACVRPQDLNSNPWADGSGEVCTWTVVKSTGTDMDLRGTSCNMGDELGMSTEVRGSIHVLNSENGIGSFEFAMTGNGNTVKGRASYTGKWVRSSCPAQ